MLKVADVMSEPALIVDHSTPLAELAWLMSTRSAHSVLVRDDCGQLAGVVSLSDLVAEMANTGLPEACSERPWWDYMEAEVSEADLCAPTAGEVMSPVAVTVEEAAELREAADLMVERELQRLVVLRQGQPVGLVTSLDLVRGLLGETASV